jgi:hypothetical protein
MSADRVSASKGNRGGFAAFEVVESSSLIRSPPLSRRRAWKEERKVSPARRADLPQAP